jgi:predicted transcriptional regulator
MITLTARLVAAYVGQTTLAADELPDLIRATYAALVSVASPPEPQAAPVPAIAIKKSVTPEAIRCLDCGKAQKALKRHLGAAHGLSVDEYRAKWGLPASYPMVAPDYAARRSSLAKKIGLGRKRKKSAAPSVAAKPRRGRKKATAA